MAPLLQPDDEGRDVPNQPRRANRKPSPAPRKISGLQAASLVKFAYFTDAPPVPGTLLYTAFRRNMPPGVKEFSVKSAVTFFYGIQQAGRVLDIQVRWITPDGAVVRTSRQAMDQTQEGALWTWQVDTLDKQELAQPGVWVTELFVSEHRVGRYPFLVKRSSRS